MQGPLLLCSGCDNLVFLIAKLSWAWLLQRNRLLAGNWCLPTALCFLPFGLECIFWWGKKIRSEYYRGEDFPGGSDGKASAYIAGDPGSIPALERSPVEGNGNPLQYSCLQNSMDRGARRVTVHGVTESWTHDWVTNPYQSHSQIYFIFLDSWRAIHGNYYFKPLKTILKASKHF